jgi:hypothetical protein
VVLFLKFTSGGLHEKHVVATWNLGNHLSICLRYTGKPRKPVSRWPVAGTSEHWLLANSPASKVSTPVHPLQQYTEHNYTPILLQIFSVPYANILKWNVQLHEHLFLILLAFFSQFSFSSLTEYLWRGFWRVNVFGFAGLLGVWLGKDDVTA